MDLSQLLHKLNFPADFRYNLTGVRLRENSSSWPVISTIEDHSDKGKAKLFDPSLITALENRLCLRFEMEAMRNGKVCFANTEEVRPDFRTSFSTGELLNYIFAQCHSSRSCGDGEIYLPFPESPDHFWELVEAGQKKKGLK